MIMQMPRVVIALATFAIGTTEFVIVGLIPEMATDPAVSVPMTGLLVSLYASSITLGTSVFTALTGRFPRRELIIGLMALFTVCNLAAAISSSYVTLLASRIVIGAAHSVVFGVGATVATALVPKSKSVSAVSIMMGGLTLAMVTRVPLGAWMGQLFLWRVPFFAVTAMATFATAGLLLFLPCAIAQPAPASFMAQLGMLGTRRLVTMYLITAFGFGSTFVVFTFISPLLTTVSGVGESTVSIALMLFGGATVAGNLIGGKLADAIGPRKAMIAILIGLIATLGMIPVVVHVPAAILSILTIWGMFAFAISPVMQSAVVAVAEEEAPASIGTASGFNIAAFNLGISGGSFLGARLLVGPGLMTTPFAAIGMAVIALGMVTLLMRKKTAHRQHA